MHLKVCFFFLSNVRDSGFSLHISDKNQSIGNIVSPVNMAVSTNMLTCSSMENWTTPFHTLSVLRQSFITESECNVGDVGIAFFC